jgi:predicted PurR-regulated permease PerM
MASLLTTFLAAFILAYVLRPVFTCFLALRAGKTLSTALAVLIGFLGIFGLILLFISVLQKELPALRQQLPAWLNFAQNAVQPWLDNLAINFDLKKIQEIIQSRISEQLSNNADAIVSSSLSTILSSGQSIIGSLFGLVLIIFIVFYLISQWDDFFRKLNPLIPPRWLPLVKQILVEIDQLLSQYLRGQLLVITVLSIYYSAGLYLLGITGALALGLFTGIAIFIPYIGYGVALILALLSALLQAETGVSLLAVLALYITGQALESFILTPKLVGEKIGLHPVLVVFALILFGSWFGFFGILLALPMSAIILVFCKHAMQAYQDSAWYKK